MRSVTREDIASLYVPPQGSHKGQNGRLLIIGGSHLFHAASLWALTVASRIVDLVHYSSVPENNESVQKAKEEFKNGIVVPRKDVESYIEEDDCILIGPGMTRDNETETLTNTLLKKYPQKQWVIDAGALQMMDVSLIPKNAILTPHHGEFESLSLRAKPLAVIARNEVTKQSLLMTSRDKLRNLNHQGIAASPAAPRNDTDAVGWFAKEYKCIVLLKGEKDIVSNGKETRVIEGGNPGMTKGGTGDVLAGLIAALACKNDPFLATIAGSFINKKAGDALYARVGPYFNATDLAGEISVVMKEFLPA